MKLIIYTLLIITLVAGAVVEVRDGLGFPVANATVCVSGQCVITNATGFAEVPQGEVEIYVEGILVWRTHATGHEVATIYKLETLDIEPLNAGGVLTLKMVKLINGTYRDVEIQFFNNTLSKAVPVGNINYPVEIYILQLQDHHLKTPAVVKTTLWNTKIDLKSLGLVEVCRISTHPPIRQVYIYVNQTLTAVGEAALTAYLIPGLSYRGVAETYALTPNGSSYAVEFNPLEYCNKSLVVNATHLVVRAVDSFSTVRRDWKIKVAGNTYSGEADLWVLQGVPYTITVEAGFSNKSLTIIANKSSDYILVTIENAYLDLAYTQPPRKVYIYGNYTVIATMPRRVELPPGVYTVVADFVNRNETYTVVLKAGETKQLVVGQKVTTSQNRETGTSGEMGASTYAFISVIVAIVLAAAAAALRATPRRRQQGRGQSRS